MQMVLLYLSFVGAADLVCQKAITAMVVASASARIESLRNSEDATLIRTMKWEGAPAAVIESPQSAIAGLLLSGNLWTIYSDLSGRSPKDGFITRDEWAGITEFLRNFPSELDQWLAKQVSESAGLPIPQMPLETELKNFRGNEIISITELQRSQEFRNPVVMRWNSPQSVHSVSSLTGWHWVVRDHFGDPEVFTRPSMEIGPNDHDARADFFLKKYRASALKASDEIRKLGWHTKLRLIMEGSLQHLNFYRMTTTGAAYLSIAFGYALDNSPTLIFIVVRPGNYRTESYQVTLR